MGKPRTIVKFFYYFFVLSIFTSLHYLSSKKRFHFAHVTSPFIIFVITDIEEGIFYMGFHSD